ncbi:hypothetical protein ACQ9ZF_09435 (plasmid) [Cetobacterium somerae]|uniref:hypothetical protein n=1 Tax=Cetobacterium somerae TaxID=188913 RepID=UPI003D7674A5
MKNLFFLGALLSTLVITGCTSTSTTAVKGENSIVKEQGVKIYGVRDTTLRDYPLTLKNNQISTDRFFMDITFNKDSIDVLVKNTSKEVIFINWSDAKYIGFNGKEQRLFDMNEKSKGFYNKALDFGLRPGESTSAKLVPVDNLKVLFGTSTNSQDIFINKSLFEGEGSAKDYARMIIPINLDSKKGPIITPNIYFGNNTNSKEVQQLLQVKANKKVVKTNTQETKELKNIKAENNKLTNEINSKDEIIRQLKEKARLKAELEKKELEIQELMKKLNEN